MRPSIESIPRSGPRECSLQAICFYDGAAGDTDAARSEQGPASSGVDLGSAVGEVSGSNEGRSGRRCRWICRICPCRCRCAALALKVPTAQCQAASAVALVIADGVFAGRACADSGRSWRTGSGCDRLSDTVTVNITY